MIDVDELLQDVSPQSPAGDNLEYDPAFAALEQAARGTPDQTIGEVERKGEPPAWAAVRDGALALFKRSMDLRVALYLTRALLHLEGINGLAQGLSLIEGLLARHWDLLHPQCDPEDSLDPTRVNIVTTLGDYDAMLLPLQQTPLVSAVGVGSYALRHVRIARGSASLPADWQGPEPDMATINAAFMACAPDELHTVAAALAQCQQALAAIDAQLLARVGSGRAPDLGRLADMLREAQVLLSDALAQRTEPGSPAGQAPEGGENPAHLQPGAAAGSGAAATAQVRSRDEAVRMMDSIARYFETHEPSSPIPLLMQRAKRLAGKDFVSILKELAPDGLKQVEQISGTAK